MQWKLRFFGSALGYLWQLVRPLLLFLVLYVFFTKVAHVGSGKGPGYQFYGTQLLGSIVLFTFFAESTIGSVRCVVDNEVLVRKIQFPRLVIPLSVVMLAFFNLCLNLIVVTIFALAAGVRPMMTWLEMPLIIGLLVVLSTGISMLLSALFVYFRDVAADLGRAQPDHLLRLPDHHPDRDRAGASQPDPRPHLHAQPAGRHLPAVQARVHHPRHSERRSLARLAEGDRDTRGHCLGDLRGRLLGVQPDRTSRGRGPLASSSAL